MQNSLPPSLSDICPGGFRDFLFGGFSEQNAAFDEEKFLANRHATLFLVYTLLQRHLKQIYRICDGDMVMGLVMSEIWQFNLARYFARAGIEEATQLLSDPATRRDLLTGCNAYSISQVLGIPSETVRRKVRKLIDLGWVERNGDGGLLATRQLELAFTPDLIENMRYFVSAARQLLAMLDTPDTLPA